MAEGKGLSKGCMAGLIVVGVLVVLGIIVVGLGYIFWDDILKMGSGAMTGEVKRMVAENPPEGVDTTQVNAVLDGFSERFAEDDLTAEEYGPIFQTFQAAIEDKVIVKAEWENMRDQILLLYPDMEALLPMEEVDPTMTDSAAVVDSL